MHTDESTVEFATEADSNKITAIQFNDKPGNGMSGFYDAMIHISIAYLLYNFHMVTVTINGSLCGTIAIVKGFLSRKSLSPVKNPAKMSFL